jgi:hypothetical protein
MQSLPSPSSGIILKLGSITCASLMNSRYLMHRLNELGLAGSVMNLTLTVPIVTVALNPPSSFSLLFFSLGPPRELAIGDQCPCCFRLRIGVFDFPEPTNIQLISSFPFTSSVEVVGAILLVVCK